MHGLEYRRLNHPSAREQEHRVGFDGLKLLKRLSWLASAIFLVHRWQLYDIPFKTNNYSYCAVVALTVFLATFSYIVVNVRRQFGYSDSAPPHSRWKHYAPRAVEVMSVSSFLFYCFAAVAYYHRLGLVTFPGMAVVCYGFSCMLSYL